MLETLIVLAIVIIATFMTWYLFKKQIMHIMRGSNAVERMLPRHGNGAVTFNKTNASWHKYGHSEPPFGQKFRSNDQMYQNWESYWKMVDLGKAEPIRDPMAYYALSPNKLQ